MSEYLAGINEAKGDYYKAVMRGATGIRDKWWGDQRGTCCA
jgi:hypothetical protein